MYDGLRMRNFLAEMKVIDISIPSMYYCDNSSVVQNLNSAPHEWSRAHMNTKDFKCGTLCRAGPNCHFNPTHIDGSCNPADLFTKALARPTFWKHVQTVLEGLTDLWKALSAATKLNCPGLAVAAFVRFYEALVPWYR